MIAKRILLAFFSPLLLSGPVGADTHGATAPEDPYQLDGYVPAGFRDFGQWVSIRDVPLHDRPGSRKVIGVIGRCESVTAMDSEIMGHPWLLRVIYSHPPFRLGEKLWILARDLEEGYFQLWYKGTIRDDLAVLIEDSFSKMNCAKPSADCWLWFDRRPKQETWVKLRGRNGSLGWALDPSNFTENASCN
jgi:hypothetical protein